ncbi:MAG: IclR family transcriptional regulator [Haloarculaceae archaeon]
MTAGDGHETVQATRTMFDIVEYVKRADGATVTGAADALGYAKSTIHRHLATLHELGYVVRNGDEYAVGLRFLDLGQHARTRRLGYALAKDKVEEIATETGERAQFIVEEHYEAVYIHRSFGEQAVHTDPGIGSRIPLHATAAGKAILAHVPEARLFEIVEHAAFEPITDATITDREALFEELAAIRERGYSFNRQENLEGLNAVGVVVTGPDDAVIGALSVSGPSHRLTGERLETELPNLLLGTANELELNIAYA